MKEPVKPADVHAVRALATVIPNMSGTLAHVGGVGGGCVVTVTLAVSAMQSPGIDAGCVV